MRSLVDIRTLILARRVDDPSVQAGINLLSRNATTHLLPLGENVRATSLTILRVLKRLCLGQDDVIVTFDVSPPMGVALALAAWPWRRRLLSVYTNPRGPQSKLFGVAANTVFIVRQQAQHKQGWESDPPGDVVEENGGEALLMAVARVCGRRRPKIAKEPLRINLGCGSERKAGFLGIDARRTQATEIVADARAVPVRGHAADEVHAHCLLEHFDDPHQVLREIHRILRPEGQAVLRLPNLGTYSSHLDTTHRFLADLALWRRILAGYFEEIRVVPVGTKYRDNPTLVRVNWLLVNVLKWYELAQGWDFICRRPRVEPRVEYIGWWEE